MERIYKAIVTDKETKKRTIVAFEATGWQNACDVLRKNGYAVNNYKVKPAEVFDYIMDHTNCYPWDWKEIKEVPAE